MGIVAKIAAILPISDDVPTFKGLPLYVDRFVGEGFGAISDRDGSFRGFGGAAGVVEITGS